MPNMQAKQYSVILLYVISCFACGCSVRSTGTASLTADNSLTEREVKQGWQLLFDGKNFNAWKRYGGAAVGNAWIVKDSSMHLDVSKKGSDPAPAGGDIVTTESFSDFHLKYDWKISRGGNSGIIFYVQDNTSKYAYPWMTGPEKQVLDNDGHADAKITKHRAGDLYDLIASSSEPVKPAMQWNHSEIKCVKCQLDFYLNGVHILSTPMWNSNWKTLVASSKSKTCLASAVSHPAKSACKTIEMLCGIGILR